MALNFDYPLAYDRHLSLVSTPLIPSWLELTNPQAAGVSSEFDRVTTLPERASEEEPWQSSTTTFWSR